MNNDTSKFYSEILERLNGVRRKEHRLALLHGAMATLLLAILLLLLAIVVEGIFSFDISGRIVLFASTAIGLVVSISIFIVRPILFMTGVLKSPDNYLLAAKVGGKFPSIRDRLFDALQMYESREQLHNIYSPELIDASFIDLYQQIQPIDFTDAVSDSRVRRIRKFVAYAFSVLFLAFVLFPSGFFGSLYRIVHFNQSFAAPLLMQFFIEPGNIETIRGADVPIAIHTIGKPVKVLSLHTRQHGQLEFDTQNLYADNGETFRTTIINIKTSTDYFVTIDDAKSEKFTIKVLDRPIIRSLQIKIISPQYTRIPIKTLDENYGDINAYRGSKVELHILTSKDLSSASLIFNDSNLIALSVINAEAAGSLTVNKNQTYHIFLKDKNGLSNIDPVEYTIKTIIDEYPTVEIIAPGKNIDLSGDMKLDLLTRIKDDFGFSNLRIAYRLAQSKYERPADEFTFIDIPLTDKNQNKIDSWYHWDLTSMNLVPEDILSYYVEVCDNDNVSGPKSARSQTFIVRLPSLEEVFSDISQTHEQSMESMQSVAKEAEQLKKDIEEMNREMKKSGDKTDWQRQKKAEEMLQRYNALKKKIDETTQKIDEMIKKMDENKLLSPQTMEKYQELQKLMEKLNSPELRDALKKFQESMKQISPEQMKQSMEQMKMTEEQFRQNLERTIELLKRIHIEQKLDELIKRTEELTKLQETLKQEASKTTSSDKQKREELSKRQEDLQKQLESLERETSSLKKKMEEFPKEMPLDEISQAEQKLRDSQTGKKMQQSIMQMQSGNMKAAQQTQEETKNNLDEFKQQLEKAQQALRDNQMKQIVNEIRRQLANVLELSERQESLKDDMKKTDPNSQRFRENAQKQKEVMNDLSNITNALSEIGKKSFAISPEMGKEIGNAMRQMGDAMQQMEYRNPSTSSQKQSEAMGSLNRTAMLMQGAMNAMMQGGKSGMGMAGLMSQLQQMAGTQGAINQGTQQAMSMAQGQGEMMSAQQQAEYQRLAGQQGAAQKSLEQLAKEAKNSGEYSRLLGDLDRIAQEMQEVQTDLQQGNVNLNILQKQDKILSRLLESTRSMRERDYEKRRRAAAGKDISRPSPAEINLSTKEGKNRLHEELLKVLEGKYTKDYEDLIKKYFEQLETEEIKQ